MYTSEEREKLDAILRQNREYIEKQDSMEILYSAKLGYVVLFANHFDRLQGKVVRCAKDLEQIIEDSVKLDEIKKEFGENKPLWDDWHI